MKGFYGQQEAGTRELYQAKKKKADWLLQGYFPLGGWQGLSGRLPN